MQGALAHINVHASFCLFVRSIPPLESLRLVCIVESIITPTSCFLMLLLFIFFTPDYFLQKHQKSDSSSVHSELLSWPGRYFPHHLEGIKYISTVHSAEHDHAQEEYTRHIHFARTTRSLFDAMCDLDCLFTTCEHSAAVFQGTPNGLRNEN